MTEIPQLIYLGVIGAAVGSFLGLAADRLPLGHSIVSKRSYCDNCGRVLRWWEFVPVVNYLGLRGRCVDCGARIPLRLLFVELGTATLFILTGVAHGIGSVTAVTLIFLALLFVIALIDLDTKLILNKLVLPGTLLAVILAPLTPWASSGVMQSWLLAIAGGLVGFAVMLLVYLASRGGMRAGDMKLAGMVGTIAGFPLVGVALFVGSISGGVVGIALLLLRLRSHRDAIPYGPYLALGGATALLFGAPLWEWYKAVIGFS